MPTILCSSLQHKILAGFDLLQQVLNLLNVLGMAPVRVVFIHPLSVCKLVLCAQFSNPTKPVLACS